MLGLSQLYDQRPKTNTCSKQVQVICQKKKYIDNQLPRKKINVTRIYCMENTMVAMVIFFVPVACQIASTLAVHMYLNYMY